MQYSRFVNQEVRFLGGEAQASLPLFQYGILDAVSLRFLLGTPVLSESESKDCLASHYTRIRGL